MQSTIYDTITNQIVAAIEAGAGSYRMPWHCRGGDLTSPSNAVTGKPYRGVNVLTLWMMAEAKGYGSGTWATYRQWQERGAQVRKRERAAPVIFWKQLGGDDQEPGSEAPVETRSRFVARGYSVFNAAQVEGYSPPAVPVLSEAERITEAEAFIAAIPAQITHGGNSCYYLPSEDRVQMVPFDQFKRAAGYYATLAHELTHWTGAKHRLDRDLSGRFGSEAYAMEELVAELGAAFMAGQLGLPSEPRTDHAPYIASWLKVLKADSRAIVMAASKAQAAVDYLMRCDVMIRAPFSLASPTLPIAFPIIA